MEEENEILDWGNEEDEQQNGYKDHGDGDVRDDGEDAVSLGGDVDDMQEFYEYKSRAQQDDEHDHPPPSRSAQAPQQSQLQHAKRHATDDLHRDSERAHPRERSPDRHSSHPDANPGDHSPAAHLSTAKMTHALPPKPMASPTLSRAVRSAHGEPLRAGPLHDRDRRYSADSGAAPMSPVDDPLPPDWEARTSRNGGNGTYYYNRKTYASTWTRPEFDADSGVDRSSRADATSPTFADSHRNTGPYATSPDLASHHDLPPDPVSSTSLSFQDRHYRPSDGQRAQGKESAGERFPPEDKFVPNAAYLEKQGSAPMSPVRERRPQARQDGVRPHSRWGPTVSQGTDERNWQGPGQEASRDDKWNSRESSNDHHWESRPQGGPAAHQRPGPNTEAFSPVTPDLSRPSDNQWSSAQRHRSPPPVRQPEAGRQQPRSSSFVGTGPSPVSTTSPRYPPTQPNRRFDRPASPQAPLAPIPQGRPMPPGRGQVPYAPSNGLPQRRARDQQDAPSPPGFDNDAKRRRTDVADSARNRRDFDDRRSSIPGSHYDDVAASRSITPPGAIRDSHRRRPPALPPQSQSFREDARTSPDIREPPFPLRRSRSPPPASVPSGPRHTAPPSGPLRSAPRQDFASTSRPTPSGPSNDRRVPSTRWQNGSMASQDGPHERGHDRDAMDVDRAATPKREEAPRRHDFGPPNNAPYHDPRDLRIDVGPNDSLPRGPRAMTRGPSSVNYPSNEAPHAASSHRPLMYSEGRSISGPDQGRGRPSERSPPPSAASRGPRGGSPSGYDHRRPNQDSFNSDNHSEKRGQWRDHDRDDRRYQGRQERMDRPREAIRRVNDIAPSIPGPVQGNAGHANSGGQQFSAPLQPRQPQQQPYSNPGLRSRGPSFSTPIAPRFDNTHSSEVVPANNGPIRSYPRDNAYAPPIHVQVREPSPPNDRANQSAPIPPLTTRRQSFSTANGTSVYNGAPQRSPTASFQQRNEPPPESNNAPNRTQRRPSRFGPDTNLFPQDRGSHRDQPWNARPSPVRSTHNDYERDHEVRDVTPPPVSSASSPFEAPAVPFVNHRRTASHEERPRINQGLSQHHDSHSDGGLLPLLPPQQYQNQRRTSSNPSPHMGPPNQPHVELADRLTESYDPRYESDVYVPPQGPPPGPSQEQSYDNHRPQQFSPPATWNRPSSQNGPSNRISPPRPGPAPSSPVKSSPSRQRMMEHDEPAMGPGSGPGLAMISVAPTSAPVRIRRPNQYHTPLRAPEREENMPYQQPPPGSGGSGSAPPPFVREPSQHAPTPHHSQPQPASYPDQPGPYPDQPYPQHPQHPPPHHSSPQSQYPRHEQNQNGNGAGATDFQSHGQGPRQHPQDRQGHGQGNGQGRGRGGHEPRYVPDRGHGGHSRGHGPGGGEGRNGFAPHEAQHIPLLDRLSTNRNGEGGHSGTPLSSQSLRERVDGPSMSLQNRIRNDDPEMNAHGGGDERIGGGMDMSMVGEYQAGDEGNGGRFAQRGGFQRKGNRNRGRGRGRGGLS